VNRRGHNRGLWSLIVACILAVIILNVLLLSDSTSPVRTTALAALACATIALLTLVFVARNLSRTLARVAQDQLAAEASRHLLNSFAHELATPTAELRILATSLGVAEPSHSRLEPADWEHIVNLMERVAALLEVASGPLAHPAAEDWAAVNLNGVCEAALFQLKYELQLRIGVRKRYAASVNVLGSSAALHQAVRNILLNSIEATASLERPTIEITTGHRDVGNSIAVVVSVQDNGPGFPAQMLVHFGESGFTTKPGVGRGHGLYIAKRIVESHGGSLTLCTLAHKAAGTCVELSLPAIIDDAHRSDEA